MLTRTRSVASFVAGAAGNDVDRVRLLEATLRTVRWVVLAIVLLRIGIASPEAMPGPLAPWLLAIVATVVVVAANLASRWAVASGDLGRIHRVGVLALAADAAAAIAVVSSIGVAATPSTWPLLVFPVAEGAARLGLLGAVVVWGASSVAFTIGSISGLSGTAPAEAAIGTIAWAVGRLGVVAVVTGLLARQLDASWQRQRGETQRLRRLAELAPHLTASRERRSVYRRLVMIGCELTGFEAAALFEYGGGDLWIRRASMGTRDAQVGIPETIPAYTVLAARGPHPSRIELTGAMEERWRRLVPEAVHGVVAPVRHDDHTIGLLLLATTDPDREVTGEVQAVLQLLTAHAAVAIENARVAAAEERTIRELRDLDRMKDEFVSLLTHELRSPMASMAGSAELLRDRWEDLSPARREEFLGLIERGTRRLSALVEDVVDAMRATGGLSVDLEEVDLAPLLRDTAHQEVDPSPRHHLVLHVDPATPRALGDPGRITQVLHNLINNAVKYSPLGGEIRVSLRPDLGEVAVSVSDPGLGIPEAERHRLFGKFQRLHVDQHIPGTGLGLYLVRSLVEAMDGSVSVESVEGQGTTVVVLLPAADRRRDDDGSFTVAAAGERRPRP